jgi:hypothetical protein
LRRHDVQAFVDSLEAQGKLTSRKHADRRLRDAVDAICRWPGRTWRAAMRGD